MNHKLSKLWLEWLGWTGVLFWMYMMVNNYASYIGYRDNDVFWAVLAFELLFVLSIVIFGIYFGRDPDKAGKAALFSVPVAVVLSASFTYMPFPFHSIAFALSPVFVRQR